MLTKLTMNNFRRHRDLEVDFQAGLNVIRGRNEGGKSTLIEAILYALYGSRALRTPLAEAATWGTREQDLWVKLELQANGHTYTFRRSKSGATVWRNGDVHVTGQNEVTAFSADLIGGDAKTASMLMMAGQSDLHGALAEGPSAVSALIGKLADFDLLDRILATAQDRLMLGPDTALRQRLEQAQAELQGLQAQRPAANLEELEADLAHLARQDEAAWTFLTGTCQPAWEAACNALTRAESHNARRAAAVNEVAKIDQQVQEQLGARAAAQSRAAGRPAPKDLEEAQARVTRASATTARVEAWKRIQALPKYPDDYWEGTKRALEEEVSANGLNARVGLVQVRQLDGALSAARKQLLVDQKCPTCGHALSDPAHVEEHNRQIQERIGTLTKELNAARKEMDAANRMHDTLQKLLAAGKVFEDAALLSELHPEVKVDETVFPPRVSWEGPRPDASDLAPARAALSDLKERARQADLAEGALQEIERTVRQLEARRAAAEQAVNEIPLVDLGPLQAAQEEALNRLTQARRDSEAFAARRNAAQRALDAAKTELQMFDMRRQVLEARVAEMTSDLAKLGANNALMRKLRGLKPAITDHLWNVVLSSVSSFFSQLRGEPSVVTKDSDGFKVNDHLVAALSGSTQDVLALAMRVALTKTFIPHAPFLCLDEPAHGSDTQRTSSILGFLAGCGFDQTLLASHDELSESVADHVVTVGL